MTRRSIASFIHSKVRNQALIGRRELVVSLTARLDRLDERALAAEGVLEASPDLVPDEVERIGNYENRKALAKQCENVIRDGLTKQLEAHGVTS